MAAGSPSGGGAGTKCARPPLQPAEWAPILRTLIDSAVVFRRGAEGSLFPGMKGGDRGGIAAAYRVFLDQTPNPSILHDEIQRRSAINQSDGHARQPWCRQPRRSRCKSLLIFGNHVKPRSQKYFALSERQISSHLHPSRPAQRGVGHRHERWGGSRWTLMLRLTSATEAYGEVVWS